MSRSSGRARRGWRGDPSDHGGSVDVEDPVDGASDEHDELGGSAPDEEPAPLWPDVPRSDGSPSDGTEPARDGREPAIAADPPGDDGAAPGRRVRRSTRGRRARQRRRARRRSLARGVGSLILTAIVAVAFIVAYELWDRDDDEGPDAGEPIVAQPEQDVQPTLVFATFDESAPNAGASMVVVAAHDRLRESTTLLFVPTTTVADVPGHGLLPIGDAFAFGQGPLLDATLDNLLGVDFDRVVAVSEQGWSSLFTRVGGLTVDVPERLVVLQPDGTSDVRFRPGEQFLDGPRLAELLTFVQGEESRLAQLPRAQLVLTTLLTSLAASPEPLDALFADGAPMLDTTAPADEVRSMLEQLADAQVAGELVVRTLPVNPIGSGEEDTYRLDVPRAEALIEERFSGSVPVGRQDGGRLLQILNGQGAPGIGGEVAQLLLPRGFRVVLTGNADSFDHEQTRIVVYSDEPEQLAIAEEIRSALGVGRVEFSRTPQSVVDITIVVGKDFPPDG